LGGQQTPVDRPLAQFGAKRRVVFSGPFFAAAMFAVAKTDLVLTVPRKLTKIVRPIDGVRLVEPPREIEPLPYFMTWHPRLNEEPARAWFREQVRVAARTIGPRLVFVFDAHTMQREVYKFELPLEASGDSTVRAISTRHLEVGWPEARFW
jgi:hypothetical protein